MSQIGKQLVEAQPIFDFMIETTPDEFYINTPGISITESLKSKSSDEDGLFYIFNKNKIPIYFGGLELNSIRMRNESAYPNRTLTIRLFETEVLGDTTIQKYQIIFRQQPIGLLKVSRGNLFLDGSKTLINPYQSVRFSATYEVLNLNNLNLHYYGNSNIKPNRNSGIIDINFGIKMSYDSMLSNQVVEPLTITIKLINTNFVPFNLT
jgi:hypothetical protein